MKHEIEVTLPDLELGTAPCRAGVWHVGIGQWVSRGDRLLEVVSDGVLVDIPAPASGFLRRRLVAEDDRVVVGQVVGRIEEARSHDEA